MVALGQKHCGQRTSDLQCFSCKLRCVCWEHRHAACEIQKSGCFQEEAEGEKKEGEKEEEKKEGEDKEGEKTEEEKKAEKKEEEKVETPDEKQQRLKNEATVSSAAAAALSAAAVKAKVRLSALHPALLTVNYRPVNALYYRSVDPALSPAALGVGGGAEDQVAGGAARRDADEEARDQATSLRGARGDHGQGARIREYSPSGLNGTKQGHKEQEFVCLVFCKQ